MMAKQCYPTHAHFEADHFMHDGQGAYRYEQERVPLAHSLCQIKVRQSLKKGVSVVVSNTFTTHEEMQPYADMAAELGVNFEVLVATGNFLNTHEVPVERIEKMRSRWEP